MKASESVIFTTLSHPKTVATMVKNRGLIGGTTRGRGHIGPLPRYELSGVLLIALDPQD